MRGTRKAWFGLAALTLACLLAMPVVAQDEDGGGDDTTSSDTTSSGGTSFFQMFFLPGAGTSGGIDVIGVMVVWVLLILSAVNSGYMIHLFTKYRRVTLIPFETYTQIETMLGEKRYRETIEYTSTDECYLSKMVGAALNEAGNGYSAMERAVEETADAETTKMLRPVEFLNVIGNIAPMMGLFGTVYGMIRAFQKLVELGGKPDPAQLAAGISTALVTTFWGLIVAIPALAGYALVRNKIDALTSEGVLMAEELIRPFKPGAKKAAPGAPGAPGKKPGAPAAPGAKPGTPPAGGKPGAPPAAPQPGR